MADKIVLSGGVRQNLLSLQNIAEMLSNTQTRLATGRKVNSPLDNAVNFFTSEGLQNRAKDLNGLLDAMSNAVQTVNAANNGMTAIVSNVQAMQSTLNQIRQDAAWQSTSFTLNVTVAGRHLDFSDGTVSGTVSVNLDNGSGHFYTADELVTAINSNVNLIGKVKASNDSGQLRIQNLSTADLTLGGVSAAGGTTIDGNALNETTTGGNAVRRGLVAQYNNLIDQLDKLSADSSFNGINLLQGDTLRVVFNEESSSVLDIIARDGSGNPISVNAANLGLTTLQNSDVDFNDNLNTLHDDLTQALSLARTYTAGFGSDLAIVQNRQNFTRQMISTLQTGADNLVVADTNEEGANMLALQTRQQLSTVALSLANQANQSVLRLFS